MKPTNKLRYLQCFSDAMHPSGIHGLSGIRTVNTHIFLVLQQWWEFEDDGEGEWRDIPIEIDKP